MTAPEHAHSACEHANEQALRDRIRDALHTINPNCVAYHATDCIDCTTRADAVMAVVQPVLDQHWADLACRTNERDQWREEARRMHQNCDHWRKRAEAAEAQLRDQNGHQP